MIIYLITSAALSAFFLWKGLGLGEDFVSTR